MLYYVTGNIFDCSAQTLVNPVSTDGVMDAGISLEFKERYPKMLKDYCTACRKKALKEGSLLITKENDRIILCLPTKKKKDGPSKLSFIEEGLKSFRNGYESQGITSAAFPKLGYKDGLYWEKVVPLFEKYLEDLPINIYIYSVPGKQVKPPNIQQDKKQSTQLQKNDGSLSSGILNIPHKKWAFSYDDEGLLNPFGA